MIETVLVGEAVAGESAKCRQQLEELIKTLNKSTFDIAELLHKVKKNGFYRPEFDTFADYYKSLKIKESKANYLERIASVMEQVGVDRNTYEPLGTNKLREISRLDPNSMYTNPTNGEETPMKEFITGLVEKGMTMDIEDVKRHVRTLKGQVGENAIVNRTFGWTELTIDETIDPGIELARRNIGSVGRDEDGKAIEVSPSRCVELIMADYLSNPSNNILSEEETNAQLS